MTKETDYGILLLTCFAKFLKRPVLTTRDVADLTGVPFRMTCKILNLLMRKRLLMSRRGIKGGYSLARSPEQITLAEVVAALEGPVALTECTKKVCDCQIEEQCLVRDHWQIINQAFHQALEGITLSSMTHPVPRTLIQINTGLRGDH